ncbi:MAG: hypothetical protein JWR27_1237, partial [Aeromicrobium sp.]|nr:hypothetical protein [Aeromicrobium sp.]
DMDRGVVPSEPDGTRIPHLTLAGGDEVQIGKYRLIYFAGALKGKA